MNFRELESEKYWSFPKNYKGNKKEETKSMVFSNNYAGALKKDGAYYRFIKDDAEMVLQPRNRSVSGSFLNKIGSLPALKPFFENLPSGTVLLGEIYLPYKPGSHNVTTIMGCLPEKAIARQKEEENTVHYYIFDVWQYNGKSLLETSFENRIKILREIEDLYGNFSNVEFAKYYKGEPLWNLLIDALANGEEGIVITDLKSIPGPGKKTARKTLKIKKELEETIDCFFTGQITPPEQMYKGKDIDNWQYWIHSTTWEKLPPKKRYVDYLNGELLTPVSRSYYLDMAGSLEVGLLKNGKIVPIGFISGLSDEIKINWKNYVNTPIEITCMEIYPDTRGLRHPKFLRFREDLTIEDCTWEKVFYNE